ncbi:MAG: hypothetical protein ACJ71N_09150 [Terriglobales bacterium]|jgi:hypothetical protein
MDSSANPRDHASRVPPGETDVSSIAFPRNEPAPAESAPMQPLWMRRIVLVVFVMFCLQMGMMLLFLPWTPPWSSNSWLAEHWMIRSVLTNYFVRGIVSGLGIIDIFIGISEAVNYREPKR